MKNKIQNGKWIFSSLLLAACLASAQDKGMSSQMGSQMPVEKTGGNMSMMDMMGKSRQSCMSTSDSLDEMMKTMRDAMKSDDKGQMKAAMEFMENHMMMMKENMGQCTGMMEKMMGNREMMDNCMMGGKGGKAAKSKSKAGADTVDHAKHHPAK